MAFPVVEASAVSQSSADATEHAINLTDGVTGRLLLVTVCFDGDPVIDWTGAPGWTQVWTGETTANEGIAETRYRIADGSEGATITISTGAEAQKMAAICYEISGHDGTAPQAGTSSAATTETPDPPALTPSGGSKDYLWFVICGTDGVTTVDSYPTDYANETSQGSGGGTGQCSLHIARRELAASSQDPGTFNLNVATEQTVAQTIAVAPGGVTSVFRKTLSEFGTRIGSRQVQQPC